MVCHHPKPEHLNGDDGVQVGILHLRTWCFRGVLLDSVSPDQLEIYQLKNGLSIISWIYGMNRLITIAVIAALFASKHCWLLYTIKYL